MYLVNKISSPFAYLFDVDYDGHVHNIHDHFKISSINKLDVININLDIPNDPKEIKLVNDLTVQEKEKIHNIVNKVPKSLHLVLWRYMLGIDRDIAEHQIPTHLEDANERNITIIRQ